MNRKNRKRIVLIGIGAVVLFAVIIGFLPDPVRVTAETVQAGPLQVLVEEEGTTRVMDRFVLSAPVTAFARRIDLEVGDQVNEGQVVIHLEPPRSELLDPRSRLQAQARVQAAEATLLRVQEAAQAAAVAADQARDERNRVERLFETGSTTRQMLEQAVARSEQARADLQAAKASIDVARHELQAAQSLLNYSTRGTTQTAVRTPVTGSVLTVYRKSEGFVNPGEPLLEIGNTTLLQVEVDVLSSDAVRITPGTHVLIDNWGGDEQLEGTVRRVNPVGFTKVSSLGVEEQRVTIISDITSPQGSWDRLGDGYRVLVRFIVWEGNDVLQIPASALFRIKDKWAVYVVEENRAKFRNVEIGEQTGLRAQVLSGLREGDTVITRPDDTIGEDTRVRIREEM